MCAKKPAPPLAKCWRQSRGGRNRHRAEESAVWPAGRRGAAVRRRALCSRAFSGAWYGRTPLFVGLSNAYPRGAPL